MARTHSHPHHLFSPFFITPQTPNLLLHSVAFSPSLVALDHVVGNGEVVLVDMNEGFMERRVDLETQDYEGTGANKDHDPKSPGGA
ncbi:hypothetical protein JHK85_054144 [Glycine max]|nr:hypothetical protein JHK85_054144 [Glycine max]